MISIQKEFFSFLVRVVVVVDDVVVVVDDDVVVVAAAVVFVAAMVLKVCNAGSPSKRISTLFINERFCLSSLDTSLN